MINQSKRCATLKDKVWRVLLVSLDQRWREGIITALSDAGFGTGSAPTPAHAMAALREESADVVLLDADNEREIMLFAAAIERLPEVPQIVLISHSERAPQISTRIGAAELLIKPCSEADVIASVERVTKNGVRPLIQFDDPTGQKTALRPALPNE